MLHEIDTWEEYQAIMQQIEVLLEKATAQGGFQTLSETERVELENLSKAAEFWEDSQSVLPL